MGGRLELVHANRPRSEQMVSIVILVELAPFNFVLLVCLVYWRYVFLCSSRLASLLILQPFVLPLKHE